jgi:hypothetical protein
MVTPLAREGIPMQPRSVFLACGLMLLAMETSWSTPLPENALERRSTVFQPETNTEEHTTPIEYILFSIQHVYGVPSYMELEFPSQRPDPEVPLYVQGFMIRRNQTLASTLADLVKGTDGLFRWEMIRGQLAIYPKTPTGTLCYPETKLDFAVQGASTWDALKQLVTLVNKKRMAGPGVEVSRIAMVYWYPPPEFTKAPISVRLESVSFREALCAVLSASPVRIALQYWHGDSQSPDSFSLFFPDTEGKMTRVEAMKAMPNKEQVPGWIRQYEEIDRIRRSTEPAPGP